MDWRVVYVVKSLSYELRYPRNERANSVGECTRLSRMQPPDTLEGARSRRGNYRNHLLPDLPLDRPDKHPDHSTSFGG